jgi:hypothetical protein
MERICILCGSACYWSYNESVMFNLVCYSYNIVCICSENGMNFENLLNFENGLNFQNGPKMIC